MCVCRVKKIKKSSKIFHKKVFSIKKCKKKIKQKKIKK